MSLFLLCFCKERNDGTVERQPLKRNTIENKQTMMPESKNSSKRRKGLKFGESKKNIFYLFTKDKSK